MPKMKVIPTREHPLCNERSARLIYSDNSTDANWHHIYRTNKGYILTFLNQRCFSGTFPTQQKAEDAWEDYRDRGELPNA